MKSVTLMICLFLVVGLSGVVSAQGITDPTGDNVGAIDITAAQVEIYDRSGPAGIDTLLKITLESTPSLPGAFVFEADVDNSTTTGGTISQIGVPVAPCPCKTTAGFDIAISVYLDRQEADSGSAFCASCSDGDGACGARREAGEWYALPSLVGQPLRALGILRGFADPTPDQSATKTSISLPYDQIIAYAFSSLAGNPKRFDWDLAADPVTNMRWQITAYKDTADDGDDITSNGQTTFDISDWAPNGDGVTATADAATNLTYCEGNFDGDVDVDGTDASTFKANFGRSQYQNPCPTAGPYW